MIHESDAQCVAVHAGRRHGGFDVRNETGRRLRPTSQLPSNDVTIPGCLLSIWIVKALSVKVSRKCCPVCALPHEAPELCPSTRPARSRRLAWKRDREGLRPTGSAARFFIIRGFWPVNCRGSKLDGSKGWAGLSGDRKLHRSPPSQTPSVTSSQTYSRMPFYDVPPAVAAFLASTNGTLTRCSLRNQI